MHHLKTVTNFNILILVFSVLFINCTETNTYSKSIIEVAINEFVDCTFRECPDSLFVSKYSKILNAEEKQNIIRCTEKQDLDIISIKSLDIKREIFTRKLSLKGKEVITFNLDKDFMPPKIASKNKSFILYSLPLFNKDNTQAFVNLTQVDSRTKIRNGVVVVNLKKEEIEFDKISCETNPF